MDGTKYRLDLNLQNLSLVSIAAKLWDSQDIKNRLKNYYSQLKIGYLYKDKNIWHKILKLVVQYAKSINLPASLSVLLKKTILLLGTRMYNWVIYVTQTLKLNLIFTEKIYFSCGLIDEIKIFDLYWRDLKAADNFKNQLFYFKYSPRFWLACIYGCEKFINEQKYEMLDELQRIYPKIWEGDEIYNIMSISICMAGRERIPGNVPSPQQMFELCLEKGYSKAARFYWEKLEKVEKDSSNLINFAEKCFQRHDRYLSEKHWENLLFLINQMGENEQYLFFSNYADKIILVSLIQIIWPCQELIIDLLKYDWEIETWRLRHLAVNLIFFSPCMNEFSLDNQLLFQIMQKAWGYLPVNDKLEFFKILNGHDSCLFSTLNLGILNLVLNDPSLKEVYHVIEYNQLIKKGLVKLVKMKKFDFLNRIIKEGFNFIPEPKEFLKENFLDFFWDLMKKDESFGLVDSFLDWSTESEAERATLKNQISATCVCRFLTEPELSLYEFELAEKFLKWRFETDAEIKNFKEGMKSYSFTISESGNVGTKGGDYILYIIHEIWNSKIQDRHWWFNSEKVAELCNAFIKFYYETDEEVLQFKKTKLQVLYTEDVAGLLQPVFYRRDYSLKDFLDDFSKFCLISSEKLREIKIQQRSDIEKFLEAYLIDKCDIELVDFYMNQLYGEVEKMEVFKRFLNLSNKAALLFVSCLKKRSEGRPFRILNIEIIRWLNMIDDLEKLKNDLFALNENLPEWFLGFLK